MNVLVTSGGTIEKIDEVRSITNMSTGRLGSLITDAYAAQTCVSKIYYVCGKTAIRPPSDKAEVVPVEGVSDLENALRKILADEKIDIIVHSMAVSDYRIKSVTSAAALADLLTSHPDVLNKPGRDAAAEMVTLLQTRAPDLRSDSKIGSDIDGMLLLMERTPKIISLFKSLSPQSTLVGFKLLHNVPHETLIDTGFKLLTQNGCSFVLANDLKDITHEQHIGYLIGRDKSYVRCSTKEEIAAAIVSKTISERGKPQ